MDKETDKFVSDVFDMCMKKVVEASRDRSTPVIRFKQAEELKKIIDFNLPSTAVSHQSLLDVCEKVCEYSVLTGHPYFANQLYGGLDLHGFAANILVDSLNTNCHTFEVAPVFAVVERVLIERMLQLLPYENGEGIFCPGGSYANMLAFNAARIKRFPETRLKGITGLPPLVVFTSDQAHYCAKKNSAILGYGQDNCIGVKCDSRGKIIPAELEKEIVAAKERGAVPLIVTATAGTTVLGSFDPFHDVADVCERHGVWLHVDASWGGSVILSPKYKHLCAGCERADSFSWNPHKMMSAPLQNSVLLLKEEGILNQCNSVGSTIGYIFQDDKPYDTSYDLSRKLLQCGRTVDAFKFWLMWKAKGDVGLATHVDKAMDNAQYLCKAVEDRPNFMMVLSEPEFTNVCFWYVPPSMRGMEKNDEFYQKLGATVVPTIKQRMQKKGSYLVGYAPVGNTPNFFRMVVMNAMVEHEDMDHLLDEIERCGEDL